MAHRNEIHLDTRRGNINNTIIINVIIISFFYCLNGLFFFLLRYAQIQIQIVYNVHAYTLYRQYKTRSNNFSNSYDYISVYNVHTIEIGSITYAWKIYIHYSDVSIFVCVCVCVFLSLILFMSQRSRGSELIFRRHLRTLNQLIPGNDRITVPIDEFRGSRNNARQ